MAATATTAKRRVARSIAKKESAESKSATGIEKNIYKCVRCGAQYLDQKDHFYKNSGSKLFKYNNNYVPICIACLNDIFEMYAIKYHDFRIATMLCCAIIFVPFDQNTFDTVIQSEDNFNFGKYLSRAGYSSSRSFANTLVDMDNKCKLKDKDEELQERFKTEDSDWTLEELDARDQVISLIGHDPFLNYTEADRRYLFYELIKYLDDDELLSDTYKLSQIIQLVNNNNQIKQCDIAISLLDPLKNNGELSSLISLKKSLVGSNDKIAKENRISVKNREGITGGKGTITGLMREMRDKNLDEIASNYYSLLTSPSSQWAAEVSAKALKENCYFDENDINDIIYEQRSMVQSLQKTVDELSEENRLLNIELEKYKTEDDKVEADGDR